MPIQADEYVSEEPQVTAGTVQLPETEVNEPLDGTSACPDQLSAALGATTVRRAACEFVLSRPLVNTARYS